MINDGAAQIHKLRCGPYGNNAYVIVSRERKESIIIDTPAEPKKILEAARGTTVKAILITHNHFDHLMGFDEVRSATGAPVGIHKDDAHSLPVAPELDLKDGDEVRAGDVVLRVIHTPGHTPGSLCFLYSKSLFTGDTLFPRGPGRTGTPKDLQEVVQSIATRLLTLPGETIVYPGHGDDTDVGTANAEYQVFASKGPPPDLCGDVLWLSS